MEAFGDSFVKGIFIQTAKISGKQLQKELLCVVIMSITASRSRASICGLGGVLLLAS